MLGQHDSFLAKAIQCWGLRRTVSETAEVPVPHIVGNDHNDVRSVPIQFVHNCLSPLLQINDPHSYRSPGHTSRHRFGKEVVPLE
jgi:hypothetical protein